MSKIAISKEILETINFDGIYTIDDRFKNEIINGIEVSDPMDFVGYFKPEFIKNDFFMVDFGYQEIKIRLTDKEYKRFKFVVDKTKVGLFNEKYDGQVPKDAIFSLPNKIIPRYETSKIEFCDFVMNDVYYNIEESAIAELDNEISSIEEAASMLTRLRDIMRNHNEVNIEHYVPANNIIAACSENGKSYSQAYCLQKFDVENIKAFLDTYDEINNHKIMSINEWAEIDYYAKLHHYPDDFIKFLHNYTQTAYEKLYDLCKVHCKNRY